MESEYGSIERTIQIEAPPEVVFDVVSNPEHVGEWWSDEATFEPAPGGTGELVFGNGDDPRAHVASITVVEAVPHRLFSFRWTHPAGETAVAGNSLLVTFELAPSGSGTTLTMTEVGFREQGWEIAMLEEQYLDHVNGWDHHLPHLVAYADGLVPRG